MQRCVIFQTLSLNPFSLGTIVVAAMISEDFFVVVVVEIKEAKNLFSVVAAIARKPCCCY